MIGWALRQLMIWGIVAFIIYAVGTRLFPLQDPVEPRHASTPTAEPAHAAVPNALIFHANPQGHVYIDAFVNGAPVRFIVDTGATTVSLTLKDAAAAGFGRSNLVFSKTTTTANGVARVAPVMLRQLRIDQLQVADVEAQVGENLGISLLGQSFLTRIDGYEMRDGVLTLSYW